MKKSSIKKNLATQPATNADIRRIELGINAVRRESKADINDLAGMMSRSFDMMNNSFDKFAKSLNDFRLEVRGEFKQTHASISGLRDDIGMIETTLHQHHARLGVVEKKLEIDRQ